MILEMFIGAMVTIINASEFRLWNFCLSCLSQSNINTINYKTADILGFDDI